MPKFIAYYQGTTQHPNANYCGNLWFWAEKLTGFEILKRIEEAKQVIASRSPYSVLGLEVSIVNVIKLEDD